MSRPRPHRPYGRNRALAWAAAVFFCAIILIVPELRQPPSFDEPKSQAGYAAIVDTLIGTGLLRGSPEDAPDAGKVTWDDRRLGELFATARQPGNPLGECRGGAWLFGLYHRAATAQDCQRQLRTFANLSYLRDDMRFVDATVWRRDGRGLVALANSAHVVPSLANSAGVWTGAVRYPVAYQPLYLINPRSRQPLVELISDAQRSLALSRQERPTELSPLLSARQVRLGVVAGKCPGNAQIGLFGNMALLTLLPVNSDAHCPQVRLDGRRVQDDTMMQGGRRYLLVQPGQTIAITDDEGQGQVFELVRGIGALSVMDGGERRYEPTLAMIGVAIANAEPIDRDVVTSIDPRIHFAAQRMLERQALPAVSDEIGSYRAAALLVDGLTGEIVAAPTFPASRSDLAARDRANPRRLDWLDQNMNMVPLAVGSMAKVPFATAIVQSVPELLTLEVQGRAPVLDSVLGVPLDAARGAKMQDTIPFGKFISFREFIAKSSNAYALTLMALAAAPNPLRADGLSVGADSYRLQGQLRRTAPRMPGRGEIYASRWAEALWQIDCVAPYPFDQSRLWGWPRHSPEAGCPSSYLASTKTGRPGHLRPIWHLSPVLLMHTIAPDKVFEDYLMTIVGQSRSLWTTAALVQAYARIVTNRKVMLRFDKYGSGIAAESTGFAGLGLRTDVWHAVMDGMHMTTTQGTAAKAFAAGLPAAFAGTRLYAKTGTSTYGAMIGQGGSSDKGHGMVLAIVRYSAGPEDWQHICAARLVVVNFEYRASRSGADLSPGLSFVRRLLDDPMIGGWLAAPCHAPEIKKASR